MSVDRMVIDHHDEEFGEPDCRYAVFGPGEVIGRTRLPAGDDDFAARCESSLRQFPDLKGWPRDRSILAAEGTS